MSTINRGYFPNVDEIKRQMVKHGFTQESLAAKGMSLNTIKGLLNAGSKRRRLMVTYRKLGKIFDVPPGTLIKGFIDAPPETAVNDSEGRGNVAVFLEVDETTSEEDVYKRIEMIAKAVGFKRFVVLMGAFPDNSIKVILNMDRRDAHALRKAFDNKQLEQFDVKNVRLPTNTAVITIVLPKGYNDMSEEEQRKQRDHLIRMFKEILDKATGTKSE